jgi:hypothetical protein
MFFGLSGVHDAKSVKHTIPVKYGFIVFVVICSKVPVLKCRSYDSDHTERMSLFNGSGYFLAQTKIL